MDLIEAIRTRHSVRHYQNKIIPSELVAALQLKIEECNAQGNLHMQLVLQEPNAFGSCLTHYGKFSGVRNYIVVAGKPNSDFDERCGYYGEQIVLLAQQLGLNTCWVGLTYKKIPSAFCLEEGEIVRCVIAIGFGVTNGVLHKQRPLDKFGIIKETTPRWFLQGMEMVQYAPSAIHQQKYRFKLLPNQNKEIEPQVHAESLFSFVGYTKIDLGIAKLHFEIGARGTNFTWV